MEPLIRQIRILRIYVSKQNEPVIETLNEKGEPVHPVVNH